MNRQGGDAPALAGLVWRLLGGRQFELAGVQRAMAACVDGIALFDADDRLIRSNEIFAGLHPPLAGRLAERPELDRLIVTLAQSGDLAEPTSEGWEWRAVRLGARRTGRDEGELAYRDGRVVRITEYRLEHGLIVSTHTDVTPQRRREQIIAQSEARFRAVFATASDAVAILDGDGTVTAVNPAAERLFGQASAKLIGAMFGRLVPAASADAARFLAAVSAGGKRAVDGRREGGGLRALELSVTDWAFEGRRQFTAVMRDVSAERQQEVALRESQERLNRYVAELEETQTRLREQAAELARLAEQAAKKSEEAAAANLAKSEFLATISHELRTPLNGVLGAVGLMQETGLSTEQRKLADTIRHSGDSLLLLINDILDYAALETGGITIEPVDFVVPELLESILTLFQAQAARKGLALQQTVPAALPARLNGDATRIRQLLFHLVGNAVKFTERGDVAIEAEAQVSGDTIDLRILVRDTGPGIDPAVQAQLFEHFTQADTSSRRRHGGTGLGLAICRRLANLMGGRIGVDSTPGAGSTFWFVVPCKAAGATGESAGGAAGPSRALPAASLRLLIAEDNPINQMVISGMVARLGYHADIVANGAEAVDAVTSVPYDLVLMDVQMPEMDGIAATRAIRQLAGPVARIPIIALTAAASSDSRDEYIAAGMNDLVAKPVMLDQLAAAMGRCLGEPSSDGQEAGRGDALAQLARKSGVDRATAQQIDALLARINAVSGASMTEPPPAPPLDDDGARRLDELMARINAVGTEPPPPPSPPPSPEIEDLLAKMNAL
ncbi:MAG: ATP-binding protein [Ferrovibrionaceae bacterium]